MTNQISEARKKLTPNQIIFAEWLGMPRDQRIPPTRKELAGQLKITPQTLQNWKDIPEIWQIVSEVNRAGLRDLVPEARYVMEQAIKKPGSINRVTFDAAKHILAQWQEAEGKGGDIMSSLKDLYNKYHPERKGR